MERAPSREAQAQVEPRFEVIDSPVVKSESTAPSPLHDVPNPSPVPKSSPHPLPSTEPADTTDATAIMPAKKKGTASSIKKAPKRPKSGGNASHPKKIKTTTSAPTTDRSSQEDDDDDEGSDNGPYCLCRGPDDHRWMICCEECEDWFHGECINIDKTIGEALIEKFICPNCSHGDHVTIYKKSCALGACKKAARLARSPPSVFCTDDHAQMWWERMVGRLPKGRAKTGLNDQLVQEEFMALLGSEITAVDEDGVWKLAKVPFTGELPKQGVDSDNTDPLSHVLSDEEQTLLANAAHARFQLAEETLLCHKMIALVELTQERRRAAITAGRFNDDICGYDNALDTISARDAFAAFVKSPDGEAAFKTGDAAGERSMCERKRCKIHGGWQKMMPLGIKHQIREMASQASEVAEEERIVREAAGERWRRKRAESNWVEVLDG